MICSNIEQKEMLNLIKKQPINEVLQAKVTEKHKNTQVFVIL